MNFIRKSFFVLLIAFLIFPYCFSQAQIVETPQEREVRLKAELVQVEKEQAEAQKTLFDAQNQSASLKRDILILNTKIKVAELNIKAKNLLIASLGKDITKKEQTIEALSDRIERGHETLSQIMRKTNEISDVTLPEILLARKNLTEVFSDIDTFQSIEESLKITFEEIRSAKSQTEIEKENLDKRKDQEEDARYVIQKEQKNIQSNQKESQRLLTISKNNESTYSQILAEKQKKAAQIRAALFALRDTAAIPFGDALKYAQVAAAKTGVRPAFLLAIITQESALGANVGSCYLTNPSTGAGISTKSGKTFPNVMKPGRDVEPFMDLMKKLGGDPFKQVVSCPIAGVGGWGGAMGPAQFIASTWVLIENRIDNILGITETPDPWNPSHALTASSIFLGDLGAGGGGYSAEWNAACRYYSGSKCPNGKKRYSAKEADIRSYGNSVVAKADSIQRNMIDPLSGL